MRYMSEENVLSRNHVEATGKPSHRHGAKRTGHKFRWHDDVLCKVLIGHRLETFSARRSSYL
eukprot:jgi/Antlo1/661/702